MKNAINWFEIPANDLERATRFYEAMLGEELKREKFEGQTMSVFPGEEKSVRGAIVADGRRKPAANGSLVYLDASGKLDAVIGRVAKAGGKVVLPKTAIGPAGYMAIVLDTEGNSVGLHSP